MAWVARLKNTHTSLLPFQVVLFELLHCLSPFLNEYVIDLPQIPLSSPESVFISLMSATELIEIKRWPHLRKWQSQLHLVLQAVPRQDVLSAHIIIWRHVPILRLFSPLVKRRLLGHRRIPGILDLYDMGVLWALLRGKTVHSIPTNSHWRKIYCVPDLVFLHVFDFIPGIGDEGEFV